MQLAGVLMCTYESKVRARCGRCGSRSVRDTRGLRDPSAGDLIFGRGRKAVLLILIVTSYDVRDRCFGHDVTVVLSRSFGGVSGDVAAIS